MKIWTVEKLQEKLGIRDYLIFVREVERQVQAGDLKAVGDIRKANNGKHPVLAKKYRVVSSDHEEVRKQTLEILGEIDRFFPLDVDKTYYKSHCAQYIEDKKMLVRFFEYKRRVLDNPTKTNHSADIVMSINERSFDIFRDEKFLSSDYGKAFINNLGLSDDQLSIYRTPEPFIYHMVTSLQHQALLIVENKDTWHTIKQLMDTGETPFGIVIYGEGKKIIRSIEDLEELPIFRGTSSKCQIYYWGDLDPEGMGIYVSLKKRMPLGYNLKPWLQAYETMIDLADKKQVWRLTKNNQGKLTDEHWQKLSEDFEPAMLQRFKVRFDSNESVPQEIVHRIILKENLNVSLSE